MKNLLAIVLALALLVPPAAPRAAVACRTVYANGHPYCVCRSAGRWVPAPGLACKVKAWKLRR